MTLNHHKADVARVLAWGPSEGRPAFPFLQALRAEGFDAMIGSRRQPPGNFEVECFPRDMDRVADIIHAVDPGAERLNVGR